MGIKADLSGVIQDFGMYHLFPLLLSSAVSTIFLFAPICSTTGIYFPKVKSG